MQKVDQITSNDCFSACLASIFEIPLSQVPNFYEVGGEDASNWWYAVRVWLRVRGYGAMSLQVDEQLLSQFEGIFIVSGKSPRGLEHAVLFKDGAVVHDPHPSRGGIESVTSVDLLYPLDPARLIINAALTTPKTSGITQQSLTGDLYV